MKINSPLRALLLVALLGVTTIVNAQQSTDVTTAAQNQGQDPIAPLIIFLQQLQALRQLYSGRASGQPQLNPFQQFQALIRPQGTIIDSNSIDSPSSSDRPRRPGIGEFFQNFRSGGEGGGNLLGQIFGRGVRTGNNDNNPSLVENLLGLLFNGRNNANGINAIVDAA